MATADLPFDLIEAKLALPARRADTVVKAELVERLRSSDARVASVVAPAGFGKTTLCAHLAQRDERAFAIVSLDERDNDPVVLLRYVAVALDRVERDLAVGVRGTLDARPVGLVDLHPTRLRGALRHDEADRSRARRPAFRRVIRRASTRSRRSSTTFRSGRSSCWRAGRRLSCRCRACGCRDARWRSGRTTYGWTSRGRRRSCTTRASSSTQLAVSELAERTEGWPAGLYLAALSLQAGGLPRSTFSGDDRFVADYLRLELLSRMTDEEVRFLTHTSVLERMCGGLCDAILGGTGSAGVLESLERSNRFLVPLDRTRTWYRYHHLFRDMLRSELEHREPGLVPELYRRAATWCQANGPARAGAALRPRRGRHGCRHAHLRAARAPDLLRGRGRHGGVLAGLVRRRAARALPDDRRARRLGVLS